MLNTAVLTFLASTSFSNWKMFMTCDTLQPDEDVDYAPGLTFTHTIEGFDGTHQAVGAGCWPLGGGEYVDITETNSGSGKVQALLNNFAFYFYPTNTNTETFTLLNALNVSSESQLTITYNASTSVVTVGGQSATGTFSANRYYLINIYNDDGNYILEMNGTVTSLASTVAVPTGVTKIRIGVSTTDTVYIDQLMSAKE